MASPTLNKAQALRAEIKENLMAAWTAAVEADANAEITGPATLTLDGEIFVGTVVQQDVDAGRWKGLIVGGAGGLHKIIKPRHYVSPTLGRVLSDIASDAGEALDPTIPPSVLLKRVPQWSRLQGEAHAALRQVADFLGVEWRITRLGLIWIGAETWLPLAPKVVTTGYEPQLRMTTVAYDGGSERPVLRPGVTFDGLRIVRTVTELEAGSLRQDLYTDETKGAAGIMADVARKIREIILPKLQLSRFYAGKVIGQNPLDGTVSLQMLDDDGHPQELIAKKWGDVQQLKLVHGLPGVTIKTANGARVRLFWDAGDPSRARAALWDDAAPVDELNLTVGTKLRLGSDSASDFVALSSLVLAELAAIKAAYDSHTHTSACTAGGALTATPLPLLDVPGSVAATKVTAE